MTIAERIFQELNPNAVIGPDTDGAIVMIEDVWDSPEDRRWYRLEYRATADGGHCTAWCRFNPWGDKPNAGQSYAGTHVAEDGLLCIGDKTTRDTAASPYNIKYAVGLARFWCAAFSYFMEHGGSFPQPSDCR